MTSIDDDFAKWAIGFSGIDGGDIGSPQNPTIWVCGIEWGVGGRDFLKNSISVKELKKQFLKDVSCPTLGFMENEKLPAWKESISYPYGRQLVKLLCGLSGGRVTDYKNFAETIQPFVFGKSGYFKLNLYPLDFYDTDEKHWSSAHNIATGFENKNQYKKWIEENRFPEFRKLVKKHAPKLIVCFGRTYFEKFKLAFADIDTSFNEETIEDRKLLWARNSDGVLIAVLPFLVNRWGLNRNVTMQLFGDRLRELLNFST